MGLPARQGNHRDGLQAIEDRLVGIGEGRGLGECRSSYENTDKKSRNEVHGKVRSSRPDLQSLSSPQESDTFPAHERLRSWLWRLNWLFRSRRGRVIGQHS